MKLQQQQLLLLQLLYLHVTASVCRADLHVQQLQQACQMWM